jgi:hypothetical protein
MRRRLAATLFAALALLTGCSSASSPQTASGVRAMYRSIGLDAGAADFTDVCRTYMDAPLRDEVKKADNDCATANYSSKLERWAEKVRLSKVKASTRIVLSGDRALVYDDTEPEAVLYIHGQWVLADVPELTTTPSRAAAR